MLGRLNLTKLIRILLIISLLCLVIVMWAKIVNIWNILINLDGEFMKDLFLKVWLRYAIGMSLYWGIRGLILFTNDLVENLKPEDQKLFFLRKKGAFWGISLVGVYQFIFNFVGSLAGWCCLYVFIKYAPLEKIRLTDFVFLIFGIMGLTGHLPQFILGVVTLPEAIAKYVKEKSGI